MQDKLSYYLTETNTGAISPLEKVDTQLMKLRSSKDWIVKHQLRVKLHEYKIAKGKGYGFKKKCILISSNQMKN